MTFQDLIDRGDVTQVTADGNPLVTYAWKGPPCPDGPPKCHPPKDRAFAGAAEGAEWYRNSADGEWRIDVIDPKRLGLE